MCHERTSVRCLMNILAAGPSPGSSCCTLGFLSSRSILRFSNCDLSPSRKLILRILLSCYNGCVRCCLHSWPRYCNLCAFWLGSNLPIAASASAQFGYGGYGGPGGGSGSGSGSGSNPYGGGGSSSGSGNSDGNGGFGIASQFAGFDIQKAETYRLAHGVLASLAFVLFFPVGAISIRIIPSRAAIWIHATFQLLAYVLYIAAFALGIWLVRTIKFGSFNMVRKTRQRLRDTYVNLHHS